MVGSLFVAVVLVASSLFPLNLPAEYTAAAAQNYTPQPEWYFLWNYQLLKFASFEGSGIYYAQGAVTILIAGFVVLPFIDRGTERHPLSRPLYTYVGLLLIGELLAMTVWGYLTPGQVIQDVPAAEILGAVALAVAGLTGLVFWARGGGPAIGKATGAVRAMALPFRNLTVTAVFAIPLIVGSVCLANLVSLLSTGPFSALMVGANMIVLLGSFYSMVWILRRLTAAYRGLRA
jgi:hypothetical protein